MTQQEFARPIITSHELTQLKEAVRDVQTALEQAQDYHLPDEQALYEKAYATKRDELTVLTSELEARGVTEADIELAETLRANPNYREPIELGYIGVDDLDVMIEPSIEGEGISG